MNGVWFYLYIFIVQTVKDYDDIDIQVLLANPSRELHHSHDVEFLAMSYYIVCVCAAVKQLLHL